LQIGLEKMADFEIAHVKFNQSSKGLKVTDLEKITPYYQFQKGSSMTTIPTLPYCPNCSETYEFRKGKVGPKWSVEISDLEFRLKYKQDKEGICYASCTQCRTDLRDELIIEDYLEPKIETPTVREIFIQGIFYQNGYYWMSQESFKSVMVQHREGVKIQLCFIHSNGDVKRMKNEAFSNAKYLLMKDSNIGVKSTLWE
tara:strand:- start:15087 stop:15683 length:597 start_codon:yes stop_codon:yes gene_type:complete